LPHIFLFDRVFAKESYDFKEPTNRRQPLRIRRAAFPQSSGHGWSGERLQTQGLTSIHRIGVFCICKMRSIAVGISGDNASLGMRGGVLGSRPKKMYGARLGDGVEYHSMKPTPRR